MGGSHPKVTWQRASGNFPMFHLRNEPPEGGACGARTKHPKYTHFRVKCQIVTTDFQQFYDLFDPGMGTG